MPRESLHRRLFRALLRLFPAEFRGDFGDQMTADFEDQRQEAATRPRQVRHLWLRTTLDMLARAPREHLDVLWRDVVHAFRSLRRHKASTTVAVLSLAIGIGLNAAVFSVVYGVLWRDLPFPDDERLVQVGFVSPGDTDQPGLVDQAVYDDVVERVTAVASMGAADWQGFTIVDPGEPSALGCPAITPTFFDVLGVAPVTGRTFSDAEYAQSVSDRAGAGGFGNYNPRVMILSHATSRRLFGSPANAVGKFVGLAGLGRAEIVGVMGPELASAAATVIGRAGCWTPGALGPAGAANTWRGAGNIFAIGRLAKNRSVREAQAGLDLVRNDIRVGPFRQEPRDLRVVPLRDLVVGGARTPLTLLLGAVVCVLLVTCVNVANLFLARASGRTEEMSTRLALGATHGHLLRYAITEGVVVAATGGALGLVLAAWAVPVLVSWAPGDVPRLGNVTVDWSTIAFVVGASAPVGVCCGLLPLLSLRRGNVNVLRPSTGRVTHRVGYLRYGLAAAEIALALMLVVGATLMVRTIGALNALDLGFDPSHVVSARMPSPRGAEFADAQQVHAAAIERVQALPGVVAAGVGAGPLTGGMGLGGLSVPGDLRDFDTVRVDPVTPGYFEALGIELIAGRLFESRDLTGDGASPIIVNRTAARMFFGDAEAIGRTLISGADDEQVIVGVIDDLREARLDADPGSTIYQVATRSRNFLAGNMLVRTDGDPEALVPAIRSIVRSIDPEAPFNGVEPLQARIDRETAPRRFILRLIGLFSLLGLGLAAIGVYGVVTEFVTQRVPEIGVRMAFGATTGNVVRLVLRQGWRLAAIGVPLGLAGAAALNGTMRAQVYGVSTLDPVTYVVAALCLVLATVAACVFPARRAARLDPVAALRAE